MLYFPATTSAPAIKTMFFMMYWPTNVGQYGKASKQIFCNINTGNRVAHICSNNNKIV